MSEQAMWSDEIVYLAEMFHDIYEIEAKRFGWKSQTPVPFSELPEANQQTMLCTVARVRGQIIADRDAELAAAQKHANDLGDLLAKVEQERDEAQTKIAALRQECYDRMEVCIDPSCTYKETLLGVYCQEVVLAILKGDTE